MSTLQVANVWFESTANNRIQYNGSNTLVIFAGGANTLTINSTAVVHNSNTTTFGSAMWLVANGNLGIGTVSPSEKLDVAGAIRSSGSTNPYFVLSDGTNNGYMQLAGNVFNFYTAQSIPMTFSTGGYERMRVAANGNIGIATSAPKTNLQINGPINLQSGYMTYLVNSYYDGAWRYIENGMAWGIGNNFGGPTNGLAFGLASVNAGGAAAALTWTVPASIDANGNFLVGVTSNINNAKVSVRSSLNGVVSYTDTSNIYSTFQGFGSAGLGSATFYVSGSGQIYSTSTTITAISDQTLKTNIKTLETGLSEVMALKPCRFDWSEESINEGSNIAGFIAQEVQEVLPDLVIPFQYKTDEEKLGLKMGDMIPTLVKAIQELSAKNDALEARLAALENK